MLGHRMLVVDDDPEVRYTLRAALARDGMAFEEADTARGGVEMASASAYDFILLDNRLPDADGITILEQLRRMQPQALVLMMTAYGSRRTAVEAIRLGAYDFFTKPIKLDELRVVMSRAMERRTLTREVNKLRGELASTATFGKMLGQSAAMQEVFATLSKVVKSDATALILGESGTGKELVAEAIHTKGGRREGPFVKLNCVAIPQTLLESELFGHEKGSFTGAHRRKIGKFELANHGTILLDEIGDMSLETQAKILRVLQEREFERVGGDTTVNVDVRIVAATNRDLARECEAGRFREDLFFRLNVVTVRLPPLRERSGDVPLLAEHFMAAAAHAQAKDLSGISPGAMDAICGYEWPGNIRQLRHAIERAVIWADEKELRREDLPAEVVNGSLVSPKTNEAASNSLPMTMDRIERQLLVDALRQAGGVQATAARRLGITERSIWHKVKKHSIDIEPLKG